MGHVRYRSEICSSAVHLKTIMNKTHKGWRPHISNGVNKTVIGVIATIVVLGGIIWIARPDSQNNNTASIIAESSGTLNAEEDSFDFGTISMAAGKVKHSFGMRNTGAESVVIGKVYTSCMCTTATLKMSGRTFGPYGMPGHGFIPKINEKLDSGEEATVEAVFDPAAHGPAGVGQIQRTIIIENNAGEPLQLSFTSNVTP